VPTKFVGGHLFCGELGLPGKKKPVAGISVLGNPGAGVHRGANPRGSISLLPVVRVFGVRGGWGLAEWGALGGGAVGRNL